MTAKSTAETFPLPKGEPGPARPPAPRKVGAITGVVVLPAILALWVWVLWVLGAIAYSYGLDVIRWATGG